MAFSIAEYSKIKAGKVAQSDMWKYSSFWYKNFDEMAYKTLLRHLISRWGIMSIEMQKAFDADIAKEVENDSGMFESVPTSTVEAIEEAQEAEPTIQDDFFGDEK